jgi:hypothetical protein
MDAEWFLCYLFFFVASSFISYRPDAMPIMGATADLSSELKVTV